MAYLSSLYKASSLTFSSSCEKLRHSYHWKERKNSLHEKDWCPYIKEPFNGFGNDIEYLGRYTGMNMAELLKAVWKFDICLCPKCGQPTMKQLCQPSLMH